MENRSTSQLIETLGDDVTRCHDELLKAIRSLSQDDLQLAMCNGIRAEVDRPEKLKAIREHT